MGAMALAASATESAASVICAVSVEGATASGSWCEAVLLLIPQCAAQPAAAVDCTSGSDFPSQQGIEQAAIRAQIGAIAAANNSSAAAISARRTGRLAAGCVPGPMMFGLIGRYPKSRIGVRRIPSHAENHDVV